MMMRHTLFAVSAVALALGGIVTAAPAGAEPRCLFQGDWNCQGPPQYNRPLQKTRAVPGTCGGWTQLPLLCPGGADLRPCQQYVPQPRVEGRTPTGGLMALVVLAGGDRGGLR